MKSYFLAVNCLEDIQIFSSHRKLISTVNDCIVDGDNIERRIKKIDSRDDISGA